MALQEPPNGAVVTVAADGLVLAVKADRPSQRRKLEHQLWRKLEYAGVPLPDELEYQFAKSIGRLFRADGFYRPDLLVEIDGGTWAPNPGRHNHPAGFDKDCEKLNIAAILGFRVLRFTAPMVRSGEATDTIKRALEPARRTIEQMPLLGNLNESKGPQRANAEAPSYHQEVSRLHDGVA